MIPGVCQSFHSFPSESWTQMNSPESSTPQNSSPIAAAAEAVPSTQSVLRARAALDEAYKQFRIAPGSGTRDTVLAARSVLADVGSCVDAAAAGEDAGDVVWKTACSKLQAMPETARGAACNKLKVAQAAQPLGDDVAWKDAVHRLQAFSPAGDQSSSFEQPASGAQPMLAVD